MSLRHRLSAAAAAAVLLLAGALASAAPAASLTTGYYGYGWLYFGELLTVGDKVVTSGGAASDRLSVRRAAGSPHRWILGIGAADGLAAAAAGAPGYAALAQDRAIVRIDTSTWTESARWPVPDNQCPRGLAVAGGKVWYADVCGGAGDLWSLDTATGATTSSGISLEDPRLMPMPGDASSFLALERGTSPGSVRRYSVVDGALQPGDAWRGAKPGGGTVGNVNDAALDPDGVHLLVAADGSPAIRLRLSDLVPDGTFGTLDSPRAVAASTAYSGVVALAPAAYDAPVEIYRGGTKLRGINAWSVISPGGMRWSPDGDRLYAATETASLYVWADAAKVDSTLTMNPMKPVRMNSHVEVTGTLTSEGAPVAGAALTVVRQDGLVKTAVPGTTTGPDGAYTVTVPVGVPVNGMNPLITVSWAGDDRIGASFANRDVGLTQSVSRVTVAAPASVERGRPYVLPGALTGDSAPVPYAVVSLTRKDMAGSRTFTVKTGSAGTFSYRDTPAVGGTVAWTASFAGTVARTAAKASRSVGVSRARTSVSVSTDKSVYAYGATAKVRVHLGTTYNGRVVSVYAKRYGSSTLSLIGRGKVGSTGYLTVNYRITARTTFTAKFAGDYRYLPASGSATRVSQARVWVVMNSYFSRSGSTYTYPAGSVPTGAAHASPGPPGSCMSAVVQRKSGSSWITDQTLSCVRLDSLSRYPFYITTNGRPGTMRLSFRVPAGAASAGGASGWITLKFI